MKPELCLDRLILERAKLYDTLLGLDEATLSTQPLCGAWTAKDVLAHIAGWEARAARRLPDLVAGRGMEIADVPDVDAYNAELVAQRQDLSLAGVLAELEETLRSLARTFGELPAAQQAEQHRVPWGEVSAAGWVELEAGHDAEHAAAIAAWRREAQPTAAPGPSCLLQAAIRDARWAVARLTGHMPPSARDTIPLCGQWTAKDVVGHLADWTATMAAAAAQAPHSGTLPALPMDDEALEAWNGEHAMRRAMQPWHAVWADYDAACRELLATVEALGEQGLAQHIPGATPPALYQWLALSGHDVEHARQMLAWLQQA
ncbi:MAG TPA: maleylpyruvate isomerase N-terminal domain-containing protein [Anaerolineae bacterium]|nr:maleylpyruvate isomerase N-terminal domain-containing protein [Anaerolineae bacterium]HOQ98004.1 maleylpyruvate isomerase N-terminal domain-containing protein [Anaerolineae bacterium]HPL26679.1 maleylpyruvate isomerase N-terminal domain-containing protein [Anaerolineae bacterium]